MRKIINLLLNRYILKFTTVSLCLMIFFSCKDKNIVDVKEFYENGAIRLKYGTKNNKKEGRLEYYDENTGSILVEQYYADGLLEGIEKKFFLNGQLKSIQKYSKGEKNGPGIIYDSNGQLISKMNYVHNILEDTVLVFHSNGKLKLEGIFKHGVIQYRKVFDENGKETEYYRDFMLIPESLKIKMGETFHVKLDYVGPDPKIELYYEYVIADHRIEEDSEFDKLLNGKHNRVKSGERPIIHCKPVVKGKNYLMVRVAFFNKSVEETHLFQRNIELVAE